MKTLRTYSRPTNVIILGSFLDEHCRRHRESDLKITDDECDIELFIGEAKMKIDSDGFISILTPEEFYEWVEEQENRDGWDEDSIVDAVLLRDFVGAISATALNEDEEETDDFDVDDYVCHQFEDYETRPILKVPSGTNAVKINSEKELRDMLS